MNAGLIDEQGAESGGRRLRARRSSMARWMERRSFNQRDSMATILITAINIIAGLLIGVFQQGTDLSTAVKNYTILTVGRWPGDDDSQPAGVDRRRHRPDAGGLRWIAGRRSLGTQLLRRKEYALDCLRRTACAGVDSRAAEVVVCADGGGGRVDCRTARPAAKDELLLDRRGRGRHCGR